VEHHASLSKTSRTRDTMDCEFRLRQRSVTRWPEKLARKGTFLNQLSSSAGNRASGSQNRRAVAEYGFQALSRCETHGKPIFLPDYFGTLPGASEVQSVWHWRCQSGNRQPRPARYQIFFPCEWGKQCFVLRITDAAKLRGPIHSDDRPVAQRRYIDQFSA
jgi:hypothetical protein